ncbi:MAG TPA: ABC transporter ATP-binding protein [Actinobacteria bacterium]|nr:ABC transporter ATP-binding protein [Actinomycetota bacterium]
MGEHAALLSGVTVEYPSVHGPVTALRDVDVLFRRGSSTAVVGRSGSGKSTLISVLSLMRKPDMGRVVFDGVDVATLSDAEIAGLRSTAIGIVFQSYHLDGSLTATENVMLPWFFRSDRTPRRCARRQATEILDRLDVGGLADRRPNEISGGERQRVAIGRALFAEPTLFVADEPTGNLDEDTANDVAQTIFSLSSRFGTTVVVVTHDDTIAAMAGRRLELVRGELR